MMITDAAWMFSPTPPAWIWLTSTDDPMRAVNSSTIAWRADGGTLPVNGPTTFGPSSPRSARVAPEPVAVLVATRPVTSQQSGTSPIDSTRRQAGRSPGS